MAAPVPASLGAPAAAQQAADAESLPAAVKGTMDGERPAMSKIEDLKKAMEPIQKKYGHYLSKMRPWREFLVVSKPEGDIKKRLETNLTHYQINYAVVFLIQMIIAIVTNPHCLVVMCVLGLVWMGFLKKNDDPNWEVNIGGMSLGKTQRWMVLSTITAIVLLCVVGQILFSAAFFCAVLVVIHGIVHPAPEVGSEEIFQMI
jgi:hypothetical protein